ncbi:MAG: tetratricopeptide repeat protein [Acidobacteria bacterium]|nr:tetratricopeptide repeat protein [Acidobacteriota bacterium]MBV9147089.1 tetratricopeptide repeat protein [Acidobacteriota bacterium]MBV9437564.1 tetratricopeptide repeat protein [Acidobacteriota bacterium]
METPEAMWRHFSKLLLFLFGTCALVGAQNEQPRPTVRHHPVQESETSPAAALLDQAETLLGKGDYAAAEPLLQQATAKDPKSYQAWYDLGYSEQALKHSSEAIAAYRKSVELNPKVFESNLNLGLALAAANQTEEATKYVQAATELQPVNRPEVGKEHAWLTLAKLQMPSDRVAAAKALGQASSLAPDDPEPHLLLARLDEQAGKLEDAAKEYRQALNKAQGTQRADALRGLVNVAIAGKRYDEAETDLRQYLAASPSDQRAHLLLGRLLAAEGKDEEAMAQLNLAGDANDPGVLRERAELLSAAHKDADALPIYKSLVEQNGSDAELRYNYGVALMHEKQWAPAQEQFLAALKLNPNLAQAYGDLAVVASDNQQYELALKALDVRAKLLGENPGTYFLRATTLDHLRRYPEATQNYRQFLAVANGKYPDEEWKARHRLLAIQNFK